MVQREKIIKIWIKWGRVGGIKMLFPKRREDGLNYIKRETTIPCDGLVFFELTYAIDMFYN